MSQPSGWSPSPGGECGRAARRVRRDRRPGERPRAADRDGLARRGPDPRLGRRREAVHGRAPRDQGRDQLPAGRPVPDHRPAEPAGRQEPARHLLRVDGRAARAAHHGRLRCRPHRAVQDRPAGRHLGRHASWARTRSTARSSRSRTRPTSPTCSGTTRRSSPQRPDAAHHVGRAAGRLRRARCQGHHPDRVRQQGPVGRRQLARPPDVASRRRGRRTTRCSSGPASSTAPSGRRPSATSRSWPTTSASTSRPTRSTTTPAPSCSSRARPPCTPSARWLVSWAIDEAPDLDFDYVNIPPMPTTARATRAA